MIGRAIARGVKDAAMRPGLVALLWAWNLLLAAAATVPFWFWINRASSVSPVTDVLLDGADLGVISNLVLGDRSATLALVGAVMGLALLALVSGAFLSGGVLEVVTADGDDRSLAHRFFRGSGHFFGRFLRLLAIALVTGLPVVALAGAGLSAATTPLSTGGSEPASLWATLIVRGGVGLVFAWLMLALDYARVAVVVTDTRSMLRTWLRSVAFVIRHGAGAGSIGLLAGIGVAAAIGVSVWYDIAVSARMWTAILGAVLVHQAMVLLRTAVRVAQLSAQAQYWKGLQPVRVGPMETERLAAEEQPAPATESTLEPQDDDSVQSPAATGEIGAQNE